MENLTLDSIKLSAKRRVNLYGWALLIIVSLILLSCITSLVNSNITKQAINKINAENARIELIEKHNDLLWEFVGSVDNCSTLEDVYAKRDSIYNVLPEF